MQKVLAIAAVLTMFTLAGCLDGSDDGNDGTGNGNGGDGVAFPSERFTIPEDPMPEGAGHDHGAVDQHQFLWNYDFSMHDSMLTTEVTAAGLHALDLQDGFLFGAVYGASAAGVNGGMQIWDLEDPANPEPRGRFVVPGAVAGDRSIGATPDGRYVVVSTEAVSCFGHVNPVPISAYLIDTEDKDLPVVADVITLLGPSQGSPTRLAPSLGEHSTFVHRIGTTDYAFIQGKVFEIARSESSASLVDTGVAMSTGHDLYVRDTPWGDTWALVANGGGGLQIYDITDVLNPRIIGVWNLEDRSDLPVSYYFHTSDVAFFDDGQILVIMTSEDWEDHVSPIWILDGTSLRDIGADEEEPHQLVQIGEWQNPGGHTALGLSFSLHNPRWHDDGILSMSHYHGGLWQLDFRHPDFRANPNTIGYAVYAEGTAPAVEDPVFNAIETGLCGLGITIDTPTYMDVEVDQETGILYAADVYMGLYAFTPSSDHVAYGSDAPAMQSLRA